MALRISINKKSLIGLLIFFSSQLSAQKCIISRIDSVVRFAEPKYLADSLFNSFMSSTFQGDSNCVIVGFQKRGIGYSSVKSCFLLINPKSVVCFSAYNERKSKEIDLSDSIKLLIRAASFVSNSSENSTYYCECSRPEKNLYRSILFVRLPKYNVISNLVSLSGNIGDCLTDINSSLLAKALKTIKLVFPEVGID